MNYFTAERKNWAYLEPKFKATEQSLDNLPKDIHGSAFKVYAKEALSWLHQRLNMSESARTAELK
jgi:hypothetical protein